MTKLLNLISNTAAKLSSFAFNKVGPKTTFNKISSLKTIWS